MPRHRAYVRDGILVRIFYFYLFSKFFLPPLPISLSSINKIRMMMKLTVAGLVLIGVQNVVGFSQYAPSNAISIAENTPRDVYSMQEWAVTNCGAQTSEGLELTSYDGVDYYAVTNQDLPEGSPVLFVPNSVIITTTSVEQELGQGLAQAENELIQNNCGELVPMFRLFAKILVEYEKGDESPYFPWLNSLPRMYNTGASMTHACFDCLPPYAAWLAILERKASVNFQKAAKFAANSGVITDDTAGNTELLKWAYNVGKYYT